MAAAEVLAIKGPKMRVNESAHQEKTPPAFELASAELHLTSAQVVTQQQNAAMKISEEAIKSRQKRVAQPAMVKPQSIRAQAQTSHR